MLLGLAVNPKIAMYAAQWAAAEVRMEACDSGTGILGLVLAGVGGDIRLADLPPTLGRTFI